MIVLESSLEALFKKIALLVDNRVGIIGNVEEIPKEAGAPDFFHFFATACNTKAFSRQWNFREAGGASADRGRALAKAIGEAVERYCSAIYTADESPLTSFETASFRCVAPQNFALYSPEQYQLSGFRYAPFTIHTPVRWVPSIDLITGENWHVPAAMVFVPYFYDQDQGETPIVQPISTGLACHTEQAESAISAICEVIERDAFTITWQVRLSRPQVVLSTLSDSNRDLVARFEQTGSSVTLLNLAMDHEVPAILAVLRCLSPEMPAMVFAASAHPNPEEAVRKSLEELAHTRRLALHLKKTLPPINPSPNDYHVEDQASHVRFYCDQENARLAEFVLASDERIEFGAIENLASGEAQRDLQTLIKKIGALNHNVLLTDLTTPDIRDLGLTVVRAIIPGFHPLFMGHRQRALGGTRLWDVPRKLGYRGITKALGDNSLPHPYP